jgi:hypothetical protein
MSARPIGDFIAPIVARAQSMAGLQALLNNIPAAGDRKRFILAARETGAIDDEAATLLLQTYQLETA